MPDLTIDISNAWKNTGRLTHREVRPGVDFVNPQRIDPQDQHHSLFNLGLRISSTDPADAYLSIRATFRNGLGSEQETQPFADNRQTVEEYLFLEPDNPDAYLVAQVSHQSEIAIFFEIDTNHPSFRALEVEAESSGVEKVIPIVIYTPEAPHRGDAGRLILRIRPVQPMLAYRGLVGLDLGNTNSTLACLDSRGEIQVVDVERAALAHRAQACVSAVRIHQWEAAQNPREFAQARCTIGRRALDTKDAGWLELGAKRLLSDRSLDQVGQATSKAHNTKEVFIQGEPVELPRREPAELFLNEVLSKFYNQKHSFPQPMIITCPTAFSSSEVKHLEEAVYQSWCRSQFRPNGCEHNELPLSDIVGQVLDEASAAGFYFLYRDYIDAPGRLPGFKYLYPKGMYLLLYDCGGGTTDVSLIHAVAPDKQPSPDHSERPPHEGSQHHDQAPSHQQLNIKVLGRTGHRNFGGDNITTAFFRILKATIAETRGGLPLPAVGIPEFALMLQEFLAENKEVIDRFVPTIFASEDKQTPPSINDQQIRTRMSAALLIWKWAEMAKHESGAASAGGEPPAVKLPPADHTQLGKLLNYSEADEQWQLLGAHGIAIADSYINALIDQDIRKTIRYSNQLLKRLEANQEVDAVYVVGNASQYRRIPELLSNTEHQEGLQVRFLETKLKEVAQEELKNSVAMGALRALQLQEGMLGMRVNFDRELMDRLPFSIVFHTPSQVIDEVLFEEHKRYDGLSLATLSVPAGNQSKKVQLHRRWPGDEHPEPFLDFQFPEPVSGTLTVSYDKEKLAFSMTHENREKQSVVAYGYPHPGLAPDTAPVQSGLL
jgi:molecular chaperone DnaK (HSP70)